jgi:hypothetical protein
MNCTECSHVLVASIELESELCRDCIPKAVAERTALRVDKQASTARIMELAEESGKLQKMIARYDSLRKAEVEGITAAGRSLPEGENPYQADSDENTMWLAGHAQGTAAHEIQKLEAILVWAVNCLGLTKEVAGEEAAAKIQTIIDKLSRHFGG